MSAGLIAEDFPSFVSANSRADVRCQWGGSRANVAEPPGAQAATTMIVCCQVSLTPLVQEPVVVRGENQCPSG